MYRRPVPCYEKWLQRIVGGLLLLSSFLLPLSGLHAQQAAVISGKVADGGAQRVTLSYWFHPGVSALSSMDTLLQRDTFSFRLPPFTARELFFYADAGGGHDFYGMISPGDSIRLDFREDTVLLSGRGAMPCKAWYAARKAQERVAVTGREPQQQVAFYKARMAAAMQSLDRWRDSLSATACAIIRADLLGGSASKLMATFWNAAPDEQEALYRRQIAPALPAIVPSDTTAMAIRYLDYLLEKAQVDYFLSQHFRCSNAAVYEWLKTHYSGRLQEKLLVHQLMLAYAGGGPQDELETCVSDYLNHAQLEPGRQAIATLYGRSRRGIRKGMPAPLFIVPDDGGHAVDLQQFRGKVVLLHFCEGNDPIMPTLDEINKCFNKGEVVFMHVSPQPFSSKADGILLPCGSKAAEIQAHYNVSAYPGLIVVGRNGNIFAVKPPDPAADHGTALTNILYEALQQ
ncbi:TlpA family protein disulfide reductase [Chitinophaga vietnamensis]|uniref:TlpA family protein disulfide reductase n=1 Tax=Chitinophaga vietnamensis TaxID=2593957 RepID=UPI001177CAFC|nr:hypothetical protein [Chitinophaga vietnamensis]